MSKYVLSTGGQADLIDIRQYTLSKWGQAQWQSYFAELKSTITLLAESPAIGTKTLDLGDNYFRFPLKHHVIYYIQQPAQIVIVAVLGKSMSPQKHFEKIN
ncbi:type II toxin-antitoxin system RelE/ParE family toxin [Photobacterium sagamiensis]|uniref:type II toxin-antitoxin system RelE/ParE family toxin n=1 Tax=Photobacterium sagamiensis TaxID=2910241 RepID=UPI003D0FAF00